jgi:hypothetical protein
MRDLMNWHDARKEPLSIDWLRWCSAASNGIQRRSRVITNYAARVKKAADMTVALNRIGQ